MVPPLMVVALAFLSVVEGNAAPGLSDCLADAGVSFDSDNRLWSDRTGASTAPIVVAYPKTTPEVASVARCASASNVGTYAVSGRHSYQQNAEMISGRVMVDVSRMCTPEQISYDASKSTLEIPAGCPQGVLLGALPDNTLFPVGNCPTVGLGGFLLGGGMTDATRYLGVACDSIEGLTIVDTGSGYVVHATRDTHPEVIAEACGSGAVPRGIVTSFTLRLSPVPDSEPTDISRLSVFVSSNATAQVLTQLQTMLASDDERYWKLGGGGVVGAPELLSMDVGLILQLLYLGPGEDAEALLEEAGVTGPDTFVSTDVYTSYKQAMAASMVNDGIGVNMTTACEVFGCLDVIGSGLFDATNQTNIDRLVAMLDDPTSLLLDKHSELWSTREFTYDIPGFVTSGFPADVWSDLAEVAYSPSAACQRSYVLLAHFSGGRVKERDASSSAFPWRNETMLITWLNGASPTEREACAAQAARYDAALAEGGVNLGRTYLNYRGSTEWDDKVQYLL